MARFEPADAQELADCIAGAKAPMEIIGRGTKRSVANGCNCEDELSLARLSGINFYEPSELAISVQAGTPLSVVEAELAKANQRLAFEPPRWGALLGDPKADPSIGGLTAMNLSGPARVSRGALRDHLLGVEFINGKGEAIKSGGRVMKNVTGYDLCKLMAGSWGTLGAMTNITLKTLPQMETEATLLIACDDLGEAGKLMREALMTPFDVISAAYVKAQVAIRIEGLEQSVNYRFGELQDQLDALEMSRVDGQGSQDFWSRLGEVSDQLDYRDRVWKVSVAPTEGPKLLKEVLNKQNRCGFLDWSGGLVWIGENSDLPQTLMEELAPWLQEGKGGHATLIKGSASEARALGDNAQSRLIAQIRRAFDPRGILSPQRFI